MLSTDLVLQGRPRFPRPSRFVSENYRLRKKIKKTCRKSEKQEKPICENKK